MFPCNHLPIHKARSLLPSNCPGSLVPSQKQKCSLEEGESPQGHRRTQQHSQDSNLGLPSASSKLLPARHPALRLGCNSLPCGRAHSHPPPRTYPFLHHLPTTYSFISGERISGHEPQMPEHDPSLSNQPAHHPCIVHPFIPPSTHPLAQASPSRRSFQPSIIHLPIHPHTHPPTVPSEDREIRGWDSRWDPLARGGWVARSARGRVQAWTLGSAQWEVGLTAHPGALLSGAGNRKLRPGLKPICEEVAGSDEGTIGDVGPGHHTRQQKGPCWLQATPAPHQALASFAPGLTPSLRTLAQGCRGRIRYTPGRGRLGWRDRPWPG